MSYEPKEPTEESKQRVENEGYSLDTSNPNRIVDQRGTTVGFVDGGKVKIENAGWENA